MDNRVTLCVSGLAHPQDFEWIYRRLLVLWHTTHHKRHMYRNAVVPMVPGSSQGKCTDRTLSLSQLMSGP